MNDSAHLDATSSSTIGQSSVARRYCYFHSNKIGDDEESNGDIRDGSIRGGSRLFMWRVCQEAKEKESLELLL
jgi:hypothetical protein